VAMMVLRTAISVRQKTNSWKRYKKLAKFSGFRRNTDEICALLGHYTAYKGNSLPGILADYSGNPLPGILCSVY